MADCDWVKLKTEYITSEKASYRKLAEKYGVHYQSICARSKAEGWIQLREQYHNRALTKAVKQVENKRVRQAAKVSDLADKLLIKVEQAIDELDRTMVTHKTKIKEVKYGDHNAKGKPTKEVIREEEELISVETIIDRAGLRMISAALKDLQTIKGEITELERREREARIEALRKAAMTDSDDDDTGVILMAPRRERTDG